MVINVRHEKGNSYRHATTTVGWPSTTHRTTHRTDALQFCGNTSGLLMLKGRKTIDALAHAYHICLSLCFGASYWTLGHSVLPRFLDAFIPCFLFYMHLFRCILFGRILMAGSIGLLGGTAEDTQRYRAQGKTLAATTIGLGRVCVHECAYAATLSHVCTFRWLVGGWLCRVIRKICLIMAQTKLDDTRGRRRSGRWLPFLARDTCYDKAVCTISTLSRKFDLITWGTLYPTQKTTSPKMDGTMMHATYDRCDRCYGAMELRHFVLGGVDTWGRL